ncbi:MAG: beta-glucosidase [Saprospiraceae bacterium]|nr:beta-glucosidase [Saprospiraceae bacterium]
MARSALFPPGFVWGTATSSYQIEGGHDAGGKGPSIWDAFCTIPGKVNEHADGTIACDHFHRWREDVDLMKKMGLTAYRFSLSWPRILPTGYGKINRSGIQFYSDLIDALLEAEIDPWITLYHWDLPLALQLEKDGWLNPDMASIFADYAEICFEEFGNRVKNWITINEPWVVAMLGYGQGIFAPGRISNAEPYLAGHQLIRAHAFAVERYRKKFQYVQKGRIGITNNCDWREPLNDTAADRAAAQRALEFFLGWFADPVYKGAYPDSMRSRVGERLPYFSDHEIDIIKGSSDFFGLNHYTTMYAAEAGNKLQDSSVYGNGGLSEDQEVNLSLDKEWKLTEMKWAIVPCGCKKLLEWIDARYDHPEIFITENGAAFDDKVLDGHCHDDDRVDFYEKYLQAINAAMENRVKVKGYFAWSFMDNFEWASGYSKRFGMHYVDFNTLKRIPKSSAKWYADVIAHNGLK